MFDKKPSDHMVFVDWQFSIIVEYLDIENITSR
jgi:hypothetical protein